MEWGYDRSKENVAAGEAKRGLQKDDSCHDWAMMKRYWKIVVLEWRMFRRRQVMERRVKVPHTLVKIVLLLSTGLT